MASSVLEPAGCRNQPRAANNRALNPDKHIISYQTYIYHDPKPKFLNTAHINLLDKGLDFELGQYL